MLLAVYGMLTYIGKISGITFAGAQIGTEVLVDMAGILFGKMGTIILGVIFVIACFNTCVGLFSCSKIFYRDFSKNQLQRLGVCVCLCFHGDLKCGT